LKVTPIERRIRTPARYAGIFWQYTHRIVGVVSGTICRKKPRSLCDAVGEVDGY